MSIISLSLRRRAAVAVPVICLTILPGCTWDLDSSGATLETPEQRASYAIGRDIGTQISDLESHIDFAALLRGLSEGMEGVEAALTEAELAEAMDAVRALAEAAREAEREVEAAANREAGDAFRAENGSNPAVATTSSGLQYEVLAEGDGDTPAAEDRVRLHYRGTLPDGSEFDSSHGGDPAEFSVGGVIEGFSEALQLMREGSRFRVVIPPELGYGSQGTRGAIGPDATLIFEIELIEIIDGG